MQRVTRRDHVLRMFWTTLLLYACSKLVGCAAALANVVVQMDQNSDQPRDGMWQDADGRWRMCTPLGSDYEQEYCACQKLRDAVFGCKSDPPPGDMCKPRQQALKECQARGLHTTSSPSDLAVDSATYAANTSTSDALTATTVSTLNYYSSPVTMPSESVNTNAVGYVLCGILGAVVIAFAVRCYLWLKCRRHGADAKVKPLTLSRSSTISSASALGIMPSQSEAAMAPLLTPGGAAEESPISAGADFGVADDRPSSIMPADLHGLESGDLGKYDENPGPDCIAGKGNCQSISSESSVPTDHVLLTIENEAVAVVDASSRFSRPLQNSSLTEPLGPVTN